MTTADFFADFHDDCYSEFVEHELSQIFCDTTIRDEKFTLEDVAF